MKKMNKLFIKVVLLLLVFGQFTGLQRVFTDTTINTSDDPGVSIVVPDTIAGRQQVELEVSLKGSAGKLNSDGELNIFIPKFVVQNVNDILNNLLIGDPFHSPSLSDEGDSYVLKVQYDHTKIDQASAFGSTFIVKFAAPLFYHNGSEPESSTFLANLIQDSSIISSDSGISEIIKASGTLPFFSKWSTRPQKIINGINTSLMSLEDPGSNIFAIPVNYSQQNRNSIVVTDTLPQGTVLADPGRYLPATGNSTPYQHIRIVKVTQRQDDGTPTAWEYVTNQFQNSISATDNSFSINFGNITSDDSYVIMYGLEVTSQESPTDFGIRYNNASITSGGTLLNEVRVPLSLDDSIFNSLSLFKEVSQSAISTTRGDFEYSLTLRNGSGVVSAGLSITDPLPDNVSFIETTEIDSEYFSDGVYDSLNNTITYTLIKDLPAGASSQIKFNTRWSDSGAMPGDIVANRGYITYRGTNIFSNSVTTTLDSSAFLYKISENQDYLSGAEFMIVDSEDNLVVDGLISDGNGVISSGLLEPGVYSFIEVKAPDGYELDDTPITFEVLPGQELPIELSKVNIAVNPDNRGVVELTKIEERSSDNQDKVVTLQGAEFKLVDEDGVSLDENLVTDENGIILITNLQIGKFSLIETKAPHGYQLDSTPIDFEITADNISKKIELTKENRKLDKDFSSGEVLLTKTDEDTGEVLSGAIFKLENSEGNSITENLTTDKNGQIKVSDLEPGNYRFIETQAPKGYLLDKTPTDFTITDGTTNSQRVEVSVTNKKIGLKDNNNNNNNNLSQNTGEKKELPLTGEKSTILVSIFGIVLLIVLCMRKKITK
ncbi:SpaA isopeptide-forming pilin-related protein [Lactococcus garvieae]|uniref:SpaA isopeptide-forming pilin-related protein n=1 Tax=Lactococcus garvieae TaxID=1363 RepID=UPI00254D89FB|nr:SpaA isopeptide-forming pilin-related protein [Lactococcus garvieae]